MAAMEYVRRHADHTRSAVLAGVATPSMKMPLHFIRGAQMGMDRLMEDCAADPSCSGAFPNFREELRAVLARFDKGPVSFELVNPSTQKPEQVSMSRGVFVEQLRLMLYALQPASRIPMLIHQIYQEGFAPLGKIIISDEKGFGLPVGMYLTVTCSETARLITEKDIVEQTAGTFMGDYRVRVHVRACQEWPRGKVPANYDDPIKSDIPILMLSGELDTATPPQLGEAMTRYLPNSRQVRIRYRSHDYNSACENKLVAEFLSKGTAKGLDVSCTDQLRRPPFALKPR
jgi:pimeloyl-ACP methyl ester carboxylesterase